MKNAAIAKVFQDMADLLELKGENPFKIRAYQRAALTIKHLPREVEFLLQEGADLKGVPGVGDAIAKKITDLVTAGRLEVYEKLRAEFPEGVSTFLDIPGIGPQTAMRLSSGLGIRTVDELEAAIHGGKVAALFRMGQKTAENILHQIQALRRRDQRIPIGEALPVAEEILAELSRQTGVRHLTAAGSLRRFRETLGDIDLMGTADEAEEVIHTFVGLPQVRQVLAEGATKASVIISGGLQIDLRLMEHEGFGSALQYFTGSKQHNIALRERAQGQGLKLSEYGITHLASGVLDKIPTEEDFYHRLGLQFIPPELRERQQEIERAERGTIPELIELSDIKGDLHVHTDWSDGRNSLEEMAVAARELGYQYLAITDHPGGRGMARGLNEERLMMRMAEIDELNRKLEGIRLLRGIEVDIRADGRLDLPDELLAQLDIVIAGVHSAMGQGGEQMTRRILGAIENPNVDVIAHPTCRLLGEREPVAVDLEAVFRTAAKTNTVLEINAQPSRLDLKDSHVFRARELGVKLMIGSDAHSVEHLGLVRFGLGVARRGWCQAEHILNARPISALEAFLKRKP
jgi:DNA polymerase (family 10)